MIPAPPRKTKSNSSQPKYQKTPPCDPGRLEEPPKCLGSLFKDANGHFYYYPPHHPGVERGKLRGKRIAHCAPAGPGRSTEEGRLLSKPAFHPSSQPILLLPASALYVHCSLLAGSQQLLAGSEQLSTMVLSAVSHLNIE